MKTPLAAKTRAGFVASRMQQALIALLTAGTLSLSPAGTAYGADSVPPNPGLGAAVEKPYEAANPIHPRLVLKYKNNFLITDLDGFIHSGRDSAFGLYQDDTRFLNQWSITVNGMKLTPLTASTRDGYAGSFIYSNAPLQNTLVERLVSITDGGFAEDLALTNYTERPIEAVVQVKFRCDYADMFEVRGQNRPQRGKMLPPSMHTNGVTLSYEGLDGITRFTRITVKSAKQVEVSPDQITLKLTLNPRQTVEPIFKVTGSTGTVAPLEKTSADMDADEYMDSARLACERWRRDSTQVQMTDGPIAQVVEQGFRDLFILKQPVPGGEAIAAGVPWFACAFGRDQLVTGMQLLPFNPSEAKHVIELLAHYQGKKDDKFTEERPGRIMHELRLGEMAHRKEIPFIPYYGAVDATPLFLVLYCEYLKWTGDVEFARKYWPNVEAALAYLDSTASGGYLKYGQREPSALTNQGWKDSGDSVMYSDGKLVKPPVALCEPQGYWYQGLNELAVVADRLQRPEQAATLRAKAAALKQRFDKDFWMPSKNYVALALDGTGRQCDVISSNPGHLLSSGILTQTEAASVANRLFNEEMFSGWGIRTLAETEVSYNPLSYHDGSVWPHDNAYIAYGLGKLEDKQQVLKLIDSFASLSTFTKQARFPELFCGYSKDFNPNGPIPYPVSCSPQAWAAGSMFQMLTSALGLEPDGWNNKLRVFHPQLPKQLSSLNLKHLKVGKGQVDLEFHRSPSGSTLCKANNAAGDLQVEIVAAPAPAPPGNSVFDAVAP
jgi:glycogen debranching enzyme